MHELKLLFPAFRTAVLAFFFLMAGVFTVESSLAAPPAKKTAETPEYSFSKKNPAKVFRYVKDGSIIVSGHRGGKVKGYPENSLEGLQYVAGRMPLFFEIDPRLTKDSVIVLMHDATLDRTTTGKGRLRDYTYAELKEIRLKDHEGNVTDFSIPTLEEVIRWSRGKTVVNLDFKDVPPEMTARLIRKLRAHRHVMLTVHNGEQAAFYHERFPRIMLSAFARTPEEYASIAASGVPWKNMIAYVGRSITPENRAIVEMLHEKGVRCMISVAPTHDKLTDRAERLKEYRKEIGLQPDIIESDYPLDVWSALNAK